MGNIAFNVSKGRSAYYASLPAANDALVMVVLEAANLESDELLKDYPTLATLLLGGSVEHSAMARQVLGNVTVTVDNENDRVALDADDVTWNAVSGTPVGAAIICYDPDTTTGTDADLVPLSKHDFTVTPDGENITLQIADFLRVT